MKKLLMTLVTLTALAGLAVLAMPTRAEAFGWGCGCGGCAPVAYRSACGCGYAGYRAVYGYRSAVFYGRGYYRRAAVRRFVSFRRGGMRGGMRMRHR